VQLLGRRGLGFGLGDRRVCAYYVRRHNLKGRARQRRYGLVASARSDACAGAGARRYGLVLSASSGACARARCVRGLRAACRFECGAARHRR